jgi:hypothetical protein
MPFFSTWGLLPFVNCIMPMKHVYDDPAILSVGKYEPEVGKSVKHTLKVTYAAGVERSRGTKVSIVDQI